MSTRHQRVVTHVPTVPPVTKYAAPKATLMSYSSGNSGQELPGACAAGVMISVTLELAGIPALAFASGFTADRGSATGYSSVR